MKQTVAASLVLAVLASGIGCSRFYGVSRSARAARDLSSACVQAALTAAGVAGLTATVSRSHGLHGSEDAHVLRGPGSRSEGTLMVVVGHDDGAGRTVDLSWGRINKPWLPAQCERMAGRLSQLHGALAEACPALPATGREDREHCSE